MAYSETLSDRKERLSLRSFLHIQTEQNAVWIRSASFILLSIYAFVGGFIVAATF